MRDFLIAQTIKACVLGLRSAERNDDSNRDYVQILEDLAISLENPLVGATVNPNKIVVQKIGEEFPVLMDGFGNEYRSSTSPSEAGWTREELERGRAM